MKVVIIDDDPIVSSSLKTILETNDVEVVAVGEDGAEALKLYTKYIPDILLMDIRMKNVSGIAAAKEVLSTYSDARILFLTTFSDDTYIIEALAIGAKGYILKQDFESIVPALNAVSNGQSVYGSEVALKIPSLLQGTKSFNYESYGIGSREYEIIEAVAEGLSNKEIAKKMYLSEGTVRNYLSQILEKLGLRDRTQLAVLYYQDRYKSFY